MLKSAVGGRRVVALPDGGVDVRKGDCDDEGGDDGIDQGKIVDGYLRASRKDLLDRLQHLLRILRKEPQKYSKRRASKTPPRQECGFCLVDVAKMVGRESLLTHRTQAVRVAVARCVVEILRIYAPDNPYTELEVAKIFSLFLRQAASLDGASTSSDDSLREQRVKLIERLAKIEAFCLVTGDEDLIQEFIPRLYAAVYTKNSGNNIREAILTIFTTIIHEAPTLSTDTLERLYWPLSHRNDTDVEYRLAIEVVKRNQFRLIQPTYQHLRSSLNTSETNAMDTLEGAEVAFVEMCRQTPTLVADIMPTMQEELRSSDRVQRRARVVLLGNVFVANGSLAVGTFSSVFREFLSRFADADAGIRTVCCRLGGLMLASASTASLVTEQLEARLLDPEERVRASAVIAIFGCPNADGIEEKLFKSALSRLFDRSIVVRKDTLAQLQSCIRRRQYPPEKVGWIMHELCKLHDKASALSPPEVRHLGDVFASIFLGNVPADRVNDKNSSIDSLLAALDVLSASDFNTLTHIVRNRGSFRRALLNMIEGKSVRHSNRCTNPSSGGDMRSEVREMCSLLPPSLPKKNKLVMDLCAHPDGHVFRGLKEAASAALSAEEERSVMQDVIKRVGTATPLAELLRERILPMCSRGIFAKVHLQHVLQSLRKTPPEQSSAAQWFVETAAEVYSEEFVDLFDDVQMLLQEPTALKRTALSVLHRVDFGRGTGEERQRVLVPALIECCDEGTDRAVAKRAARVLMQFPSQSSAQEEWFLKIEARFLEHMQTLELDNLPAVFASVVEFAAVRRTRVSSLVSKCLDTIAELLRGRLLSADDQPVEVIISGLKAGTKLLCQVDLRGTTKPFLGEFCLLLRKLVSKELALFECLGDRRDCETVQMLGAKCLIKLQILPTAQDFDVAQSFLKIADFAQASSEATGEVFLRWIYTRIMHRKVPFRWICILPFTRTEKAVQTTVMTVEYRTDDEDSRRFGDSCLRTFLECLLQSVEYAHFTRLIIRAVNAADSSCGDPEVSHRLHFVASTATSYLDKFIQTKAKHDIRLPSMMVRLPRDMFRPRQQPIDGLAGLKTAQRAPEKTTPGRPPKRRMMTRT